MADRIAVSALAAGSAGASYRKLLTYSQKAAGSYPINETNFAGVGSYLPCNALVAVTAGAAGAKIQVSYDNGTNWLDVNAAAGATQFASYLHLDTAVTFQIVITTNAADVRIFVQ
jgi:hypothetical protein